jgi:predicted 3-demethylubiquinone-9 3-methyltransferase (glyoxalase superfamily)
MHDTKQRITPNLWFDTQAEDAALFYVSVFKDSRIITMSHYGSDGPGPAGSVMVVSFELEGQRFTALNGGPAFTISEAVSFIVNCETQDEVDFFWEKLSEGGDEQAQMCGWLKDRYGVSWQIVPAALPEILGGADREGAQRAMQAMLKMKKLDIDALRSAYEGTDASSAAAAGPDAGG